MRRRHAAVAVVAVALLALLGAATPAVATNGTATANGTATTAATAETTEANATRTTVAADAVELATDGDDAVVVRPAADQTVRGESSLPEGTELSVRMRSSGDRTFLRSKTTTVGEDGAFAVALDFGDFAGDTPVEATVSVRTADGDLVREYEAVVRSASETESPGSATTSATVPGFGAATAGAGIAAALVAVLALTRRTD